VNKSQLEIVTYPQLVLAQFQGICFILLSVMYFDHYVVLLARATAV